ncbi:MAG: lysophospholipid acyltransferase family protein [Anaerolineae bacterium]
MNANSAQYRYPRRRLIRFVFSRLGHMALSLLSDFRIIGREHLPGEGPLIVVGNHFHFTDTVAFVTAIRGPMEFLGGFQLIDAPPMLTWIPKLWGYYKVRRGGASRDAMRAATAILAQDGVLAIFPEGGSWAPVLRPPRPGTAYLAARTGARILPVGLDGLTEMFPALRRGKRARVTVRIGKPFGPFEVAGRGRARRAQLEAIGEEIMRQIAGLIPPERHGVYSADPILRAAAQAAAVYPFADSSE